MRLFLVRHGETNWNRSEVFRGRVDVELNERGIDQARRTGTALKDIELAAVYTSPLSRACQTARSIALPHGLEVEIVEELTDIDFGSWQGLSHQEVIAKYPDMYRLWKTAPHQVCFEGGETLGDVLERSVAVINRIIECHRDHNVAVVSHRVVTKVLLCHYIGLSAAHFWRIKQDTCAINVVDFDQEGNIVTCHLNDISHLAPMYKKLNSLDF